MTHFLFFHTLCLGLQGVETLWPIFFFFAWFLVSSYTHSFFLLSVYCDEIARFCYVAYMFGKVWNLHSHVILTEQTSQFGTFYTAEVL